MAVMPGRMRRTLRAVRYFYALVGAGFYGSKNSILCTSVASCNFFTYEKCKNLCVKEVSMAVRMAQNFLSI